ncbi:conserved exported hypothetical protein [Candidatus Sulfopaludibacter sp. SbA3]|nr:conserved exported hypothetical protein [Candidatus Sulfopaludibacter sp. SbA3]
MRYLTLTMLLSGVLAAQTQNWRQPNLQQYFKQFKVPEAAVRTQPKITLAPGQKCAIPLLNVLKKDNTNDHMTIQVPPSHGWTMPIVAPPAPSCDDVR